MMKIWTLEVDDGDTTDTGCRLIGLYKSHEEATAAFDHLFADDPNALDIYQEWDVETE